MANAKIYGKDSLGNEVIVKVNSSGELFLDPSSVGAGGGGSGGGLTDAELRAAAVPVSLDDASLAALETINAVVSDGGGSITVDGSVGVSGTVAISNFPAETAQGLTDAQLRATAVPVSGTVTATGPLTDAQLRATPVPVSGTVTITDGSGPVTVDGTVAVSGTVPVSGPLTDTQLRASAVPVSGTVDLGSTSLTALEHISIDNFPATQPVSGTVAISGTVPVSGSVTVSDGSGPLTVDGTVALDSATITSLTSGGALTNTQLRASAVPMSIADGSDAATGTTTDSSTANTVIGRLKKLISLLPAALGSATSANSLPVVIASDQGAVPVSGTFYQATQPVSVADTTASGSITASTQTVQSAVAGHSVVGFSFSGTFSGLTIVAERSMDGGTSWNKVAFYATIGVGFFGWNSPSLASVPIAAAQQVLVEGAGATHLRVRAVAFTSGTASVAVTATAAPLTATLGTIGANGFPSIDLTATGSPLAGAVPSDGDTNSHQSLYVIARGSLFNESNWDKQRGNTNLTVLSSAARTTTQTSADQVNYNHTDLVVVIDVTAVTSTPSLVVTINGKDALSGKYYTLLTSAAISTVSTVVLRVGSSFGAAAANLIAVDRLPRTWQVVVTAGNANSATYSVGAGLLL